MNEEQELRDLIDEMLNNVDAEALPSLAQSIETEEGMKVARAAIFTMAVRDRISIQSAASLYDSDL